MRRSVLRRTLSLLKLTTSCCNLCNFDVIAKATRRPEAKPRPVEGSPRASFLVRRNGQLRVRLAPSQWSAHIQGILPLARACDRNCHTFGRAARCILHRTSRPFHSHGDTWGILFKNPAQERSNARKFIVWPNRQQALSMPSVVRLERQFLTGRSASKRRLPIDPRPCGLDLRRQAQHHRLIAISRDELDRDRQPSRRARSLHLTHREHDRWLARDVEPHSERGQRKYPAPILVHVFEHHVNPTELDRSGRRKS